VNDCRVRTEELVGRSYAAEGRTWRVSTVLKRHDGIFLFLRRAEGSRIIMREVLLDMDCIIDGGEDEGSCTQAGTQDRGSKARVCKDAAHRDMEDGKVGATPTKGEAGSRDVGTGAGEGQA